MISPSLSDLAELRKGGIFFQDLGVFYPQIAYISTQGDLDMSAPGPERARGPECYARDAEEIRRVVGYKKMRKKRPRMCCGEGLNVV